MIRSAGFCVEIHCHETTRRRILVCVSNDELKACRIVIALWFSVNNNTCNRGANKSNLPTSKPSLLSCVPFLRDIVQIFIKMLSRSLHWTLYHRTDWSEGKTLDSSFGWRSVRITAGTTAVLSYFVGFLGFSREVQGTFRLLPSNSFLTQYVIRCYADLLLKEFLNNTGYYYCYETQLKPVKSSSHHHILFLYHQF